MNGTTTYAWPNFLAKFATYSNRWYALIFIALGLAIIVIDNTILTVSVPYIVQDLNTTIENVEWAITGYSLTIAAVLITMGRIGDLIGRKKLFLIGIIIFAVGSFIGSESHTVTTLIIGRAIIQALGAAISLTTALALLASHFYGRERAIAFGIWGAIAGASATLGPLLGGYLTTYFSWRWSLRINIIIAIIAILGSIFVQESKGEAQKKFDIWGTILSALGLFAVVFGFVEGSTYGWWSPTQTFSILGWQWPFTSISIIPFFFALGIILLATFVFNERHLEKRNASPLLRISMFKKRGVSIGSAALTILALGQLSVFFVLPIYFEIVLLYNALTTGLVLLYASVTIFVAGAFSGFLISRLNIKWLVVIGSVALTIGSIFLIPAVSVDATSSSFALPLIAFGLGFGLGSAQLNNIIISAAPDSLVGEASAVTAVVRQVGASIGVAVAGAILTSTFVPNINNTINADPRLPGYVKQQVTEETTNLNLESGTTSGFDISKFPSSWAQAIKNDINTALVDSSQKSLLWATIAITIGTLLTFFLPKEQIRKSATPRAE